MAEYIVRLKKLGFKSHEIARIYFCFKKYFDLKHLNDFVTDLEEENYVADVQP